MKKDNEVIINTQLYYEIKLIKFLIIIRCNCLSCEHWPRELTNIVLILTHHHFLNDMLEDLFIDIWRMIAYIKWFRNKKYPGEKGYKRGQRQFYDDDDDE